VYLNPTEPFNLYLEVALVGGLFEASPFVFYQLWLFIAPGLYRKEKRYVMPFLLSTVGLFIAGGLFGYKMVYPASLDFLIGYGQRFQPMITIGEYTKLFVTIIVGLGLIFEMPILVFFLAVMRVITARWMLRNLRYAILVIFIIAAIVTPTADILNMCLFAAPMVAPLRSQYRSGLAGQLQARARSRRCLVRAATYRCWGPISRGDVVTGLFTAS
jgi:sec-independent protein translocase protein TatC